MHQRKVWECVRIPQQIDIARQLQTRFSAYWMHYPYLALTNMSLRLLNIDCIIKKHAPLNTTAAAVATALVLIANHALCSEGYS
jgi:hypothetical protein